MDPDGGDGREEGRRPEWESVGIRDEIGDARTRAARPSGSDVNVNRAAESRTSVGEIYGELRRRVRCID